MGMSVPAVSRPCFNGFWSMTNSRSALDIPAKFNIVELRAEAPYPITFPVLQASVTTSRRAAAWDLDPDANFDQAPAWLAVVERSKAFDRRTERFRSRREKKTTCDPPLIGLR